MAKDAQKRQRARQRKEMKKRANKKQRQRALASGGWPSTAETRWPVMECAVTADWNHHESLATVIVARRQEGGGPIAMATFLVDLQCLGAKDAFAMTLEPLDYRHKFEISMRYQDVTSTSLDLAAKIVREGVAYAQSLGFPPPRDVKKSLPMLHGACPEACDEPVLLGGPNGRPLFIEGPADNTKKILRVLDRAVGQDGFDFAAASDRYED